MRGILREILEGILNWRLWWTMAWYDTRGRYRRSVLGPLWLTLSMALTVMMLGVIYSYIMNAKQDIYIPHLALGFIIWTYMSTLLIDSCRTFVEASQVIRQRRLPLTLFVMRVICRNVISLFHNALVYLPVAVYYRIVPTWSSLEALAGFALLLVNSLWVSLLVAILCARYRDIPQLIGSLVSMLFFLTPVIWGTKEIGSNPPLFLVLNPFFHFMEIIRAPLLGNATSAYNWIAAIGITVGGSIVATVGYALSRRRVVFWI